MSSEWNKEKIVELLSTNDKAIGRALLRLHKNQTSDEQEAHTVSHRNGMGFRPCNANMGSSMAKFFEKNGYLTPKQIAYWRTRDKKGNMRIGIYAGQLLKEIGS